jgi:Arc/MetJ family transcription regulator
VHHWCICRANIDIDDELVAEAMRRYGLRTKKEAVDRALVATALPDLRVRSLI